MTRFFISTLCLLLAILIGWKMLPSTIVDQASASLHSSKAIESPIQQSKVAVAEAGEELSGGQATVFDTTHNAFAQPAPGLERMDELLFFVGNSFFNQNWVTAPASTKARDDPFSTRAPVLVAILRMVAAAPRSPKMNHPPAFWCV